ncbi:MgtC/SapB family protein [Intestinibacter sp.]
MGGGDLINEKEIIIRLLICLVIGGLTGLEREKSNQFAGFRTHILVALGSCITSIAAVQLFISYNSYSNMDPGRLPAQVLSGIGFIGAGAILKNSSGITGLTTAAGIWATACIGIAIGYGQYVLGITAWVLAMITLLSLKRIDKIFFKKTNCNLYLTISSLEAITATFAILKECKISIRNFDVDSKGNQIWTAAYSISYDRRIIIEELEKQIRNVDGVLDLYFYGK